MPAFASFLVAGLALASSVTAAPSALPDRRSTVERDGTVYSVFEHASTGSRMEFVKNSGICETTPGVNQYSGYLSVGDDMNMWFWFFEARNSPESAPLATWFNGGPGCSSMIGLFQENGPCHFEDGASTPSNNTNSWNNYANMLYIDQPIGAGFSYGNDTVFSTAQAAPFVWTLLQAFYAQFPQYTNRDFGIFTESYGGHYGPEFAWYIEQQNSAIAAGQVQGDKINLVALGVNNGWFDATLQYKAYIDYAYNNSYNQIITSKSSYNRYLNAYKTKCVPALAQCNSTGSNQDCSNAQNTCYSYIEGPISSAGNFDVYDVREPSNDPYPPPTYKTYLNQSSVVSAIGARSAYQECADIPYDKFSITGDNSRSLLPHLRSVLSNIPVLIWAGDADFICNVDGSYTVSQALVPGFASSGLAPYTVDGQQMGEFAQQGNLNFLKVYGAGHEVPYYQPEIELQAFQQMMQGGGIATT